MGHPVLLTFACVCVPFGWDVITNPDTHTYRRTQTHTDTHVHTLTHVRVRAHTHTHARTHTRTHARTHTHTHTHTHTRTRTRTRTLSFSLSLHPHTMLFCLPLLFSVTHSNTKRSVYLHVTFGVCFQMSLKISDSFLETGLT